MVAQKPRRGGIGGGRAIRRRDRLAPIWAWPLAALALAGPAQAEKGEGIGDASAVATAGTPEIVVLGQGRNRLTMPGSSTIIGNSDLERSRPLTINEALRQAPGLFPRDEEGLGLRPNIGVRGLSPTRSSKVLQLEDGIPLTFAPYSDNATYSMPPFRRFERIETLKGASQVRFGPNTVGGVINYITPRAPETFAGESMIAFGDRGYREADVKIGGPLVGDLRFIAHANTTRFDGLRDNHDFNLTDIWLKIEGALAPDHDASLRVGFAQEDSKITYSGLTSAEYAANPRFNPFKNDSFVLERFTAALSHQWRVSESLELKSSAYALWFDRDWWRQSSNSGQRPNDASDALRCGGMANLSTTCGNEGRLREYNTYGLESRLTWRGTLAGSDATVEAGARHHLERQNRLQVNGDSPTSRTPGIGINGGVRESNLRYADATSGFLALQMQWGPLTLSPGVRLEHVVYERHNRLTMSSGKTDITETIPGLGFAFELSPQTVVYGGAHRGFSPPRAEDIVSLSGGVVDIDPESSTNVELGMRSESLPGIFADIAFFGMDFDNQIVPATVAGGQGATLTNGGKTRHAGVEAALHGSMRDMGLMAGGDDVTFRTALTYLGAAKFVGARNSTVAGFSSTSVRGNRLPYAPEWIASVAVGYVFGEAGDMQLELQHTGDQYTDDLNSVAPSPDGQRGKIGAATLVNLTVNARPFGDQASLFFTVKNLADEAHIVDRSRGILPGAPRLMQAGVQIQF